MNRISDIEKELEAVEILRTLKRHSTYKSLSSLTGLSEVTLSRYVEGHVLPTRKRAEKIIKSFGKGMIKKETRKLIKFGKAGLLDNTNIIFNTSLLKKVSREVSKVFSKPDKVFTLAVDGIPIAVHMANRYNVPCVYAKKDKEIGVDNFLHQSHVFKSGVSMDYFLPVGILKKNEKILIVDDMIRSGETLKVLINMVRKTKAKIIGIFVLLCLSKRGLRKIKKMVDCPVEAYIIV